MTLVLLASVSTPQWGQLLAHRHWFGTSTPILRPSLELKNRHIPRRQPWPPQRCPRATATLHDLAAVHTCSYPPPWPTQYTHIDTGPPPPRPTFLAPEPDRLENSNQLKPSQPCVSAITDLYTNVHIAIHPQLPTMTLTGGSSIVSRLSGMSLVELRWRLLLEEFGVTFHYVKGKHNIVADALSRLAIDDDDDVAGAISRLETSNDDNDDGDFVRSPNESLFVFGTKPLMLSRDKVIWSRKCTSKMMTSPIMPLHEKVCNKTAWIRVPLVMGSTLMCRIPMFS